jgi:hypothetical protein
MFGSVRTIAGRLDRGQVSGATVKISACGDAVEVPPEQIGADASAAAARDFGPAAPGCRKRRRTNPTAL